MESYKNSIQALTMIQNINYSQAEIALVEYVKETYVLTQSRNVNRRE